MTVNGTILAGDVGGTKTVLGLFERGPDGLRLVRDGTYPSQAHATLEEILTHFLDAGERPTLLAGCFGVAGPIINGECRTTNLPWTLTEVGLAQVVRAPRVKLLNDLEAAAFGMLHLAPDEMVTLQEGDPLRRGNIAVVAAGTGLGEAMLYWDGQVYHPIAGEGGHTEFGPRNDLEIDLLLYLRKKYNGHVSYERILSGPGFFDLYCFLRDTGRYPETPELAEAVRRPGEASQAVAEAGLAGRAEIAVQTLELFAEMYGAEAGNVALKCLAVGGVFVGGGIAPKLLPVLQGGAFLRGLHDKGRFAPLLRGVPVKIALNPRAPLLGAAHYAARLA